MAERHPVEPKPLYDPLRRVKDALLDDIAGSAGTATWGGITGTLADQTDLQAALASKAPLASPPLTGTPTAPTASAGTNTPQIATTAFVRAEVAALVGTVPSTLDTLDELANALGDDPNFVATMTTALGLKLNSASYTAADVLAKLLTVDGAGTGLDADRLDGQEGTYYLARANHTGTQLAATISDFSTAADARIAAATGTSGNTIPKNNTANTFSAPQTINSGLGGTALTLDTNALPQIIFKNAGTISGDVTSNATNLLVLSNSVGGTRFTLTQLGALTIVGALSASNVSGNNTGDQTSIVGITGTKAQFNTANSDGDFVFTSDLGTGVATFLATPSSANLLAALTTKTGTGNNVFSISPTFTGTLAAADINASGRGDFGNVISVSGGAGFSPGPRLNIYFSGGAGLFDSYNSTTATYLPMIFSGSNITFRGNGAAAFSVNGALGNYANDAAAAAGGVPVGYLYRNGSVLMIRVV